MIKLSYKTKLKKLLLTTPSTKCKQHAVWYPWLNIDVVQAQTLTAMLFEIVEDIPSFLDDRLASVEILDNVWMAGDLFKEITRRHESKAHALQKDGHVLYTSAVAIVDPAYERFERLVFGLDVEGIVADEVTEVVSIQYGQEIVAASGHLDKMLQQVCYKNNATSSTLLYFEVKYRNCNRKLQILKMFLES